MTLFFPDLNVWLALSSSSHIHSRQAWHWFSGVSEPSALLFARYTQLGLLRLLTNTSVSGAEALTVEAAWNVYDALIVDPRIRFSSEPEGVDATLRKLTRRFAKLTAPKVIGDCYLLALAESAGATLVTFDKALSSLARSEGLRSLIPE
jgi:toxin-antitoxin system PIN domain toxin